MKETENKGGEQPRMFVTDQSISVQDVHKYLQLHN